MIPSLVYIKTGGSPPPQKISDLTHAGSAGIVNVHFVDSGRAISSRSFIGGDRMPSSGFAFITSTYNPSPSEIEFEEQKREFKKILPLILEQYRGLYIAVRKGEIVDSDADLDMLTNRFFTGHGDVPVYVTKVGEEMEEVIDTPFFG